VALHRAIQERCPTWKRWSPFLQPFLPRLQQAAEE
jgi:hypothetical protein